MLAVRMRDNDDPFVEVKKLIQELIARLQDEANNEAQHKQWCDQELSANQLARTTKTQEVEGLHATIEQLQSRIAMLQREIADLTQAVATLAAELAQAAKLRAAEQASNEDTIADAAGAQVAVAQASQILKDYYAKAATSTVLLQGGDQPPALVQRAMQAPPPIFQKPFQGQQGENQGILAFLEVINSNFARLESETSAAEQSAQSAYDAMVADATDDQTAKQSDITAKKTELSGKEQDLQTADNNLDLAQSELESALAYYEKLRPSCVGAEADVAWQERSRRRQEEIAALREALDILNGQTIVAGPDSLYSSVDGGNRGWDIGITANATAL